MKNISTSEKFFFLSVKGHALDPLKLISQNQAAFVSCDWSVSNEYNFSFFHEVLSHRRSKKRFLYSIPETKFLQKGFCRETLFAQSYGSFKSSLRNYQKILQDKSVFEAPTLGISMNM